MKSAKGGINPTVSDEVAKAMKSLLRQRLKYAFSHKRRLTKGDLISQIVLFTFLFLCDIMEMVRELINII